jgi:sugar lactone lactonase YvrE
VLVALALAGLGMYRWRKRNHERRVAVSRRCWFNTVILVALVLSVQSTCTAAILYVSNSGQGTGATIGEYTTNGSVINGALVSTGLGFPDGIVVNNGLLYVADNGDTQKNIQTFTTKGVAVKRPLISGLVGPTAVAFDGQGHLFVTENNGIGEYTLTGSAVNPSLISGPLAFVEGVACDGNGRLFVSATTGVISEYTTGGTPINTNLIFNLNQPTALALDGNGDLFVCNELGGTIGEYITSGGVVKLVANFRVKWTWRHRS